MSKAWSLTNASTHHAHECPKCGLVWEHDPIVTPKIQHMTLMGTLPYAEGFAIDQRNVKSHTCPRCGPGYEQWYTYQGSKGAVVVNDGH